MDNLLLELQKISRDLEALQDIADGWLDTCGPKVLSEYLALRNFVNINSDNLSSSQKEDLRTALGALSEAKDAVAVQNAGQAIMKIWAAGTIIGGVSMEISGVSLSDADTLKLPMIQPAATYGLGDPLPW